MSLESFKKSYNNSDIPQLRKFIKKPKVLSTHKFMTYVEKSFTTNRAVYDILILILFNKYDLDKIAVDMIDRDNVDLMENIFTSFTTDLVLDYERLIPLTVPRGRVSMAKMIYEYNHGNEDSYEVVNRLLRRYEFVYDENKNSIDSLVLALCKRNDDHAKLIIPYINPNFWDDFAIKYATQYNSSILKILLSHNMVDPGVDDNFPLKIAIENCYRIANELLKHPLVAVNNINLSFIEYLIEYNCLCVAERLLRCENNNIIRLFKKPEIINAMIEYHNDITYLAIKLGIFNKKKLLNISNSYLANFKIDDTYVIKPYDQNLDPVQIYKKAIEYDDIDQVKSIRNYPISITPYFLLHYLVKYGQICDTDSYKYVWNNILKKYNPTILLITAAQPYKYDPADLFKEIFKIVKDNPILDYEEVYLECDCDNHYYEKEFMEKKIKENYNTKEYKKFYRKYIEEWSDNEYC